ncbi:MAG TPA: ABC transporter ATP-binding protein [Acidobacteriaceae bacterium]|nr:ABC transporter ATP-binding protein [Acidobacteriaceae bacterium]
MPPALVFDRISKYFGKARALGEVSFAVEPGEILGLVGPNGAGKTTAMQIATGFLLPSSGDGSLMGRRFSDAAARRQLGFVPDAPVFFQGNALSALRFAAALNDLSPSREEMEQVLTRVGLTEWKRDVRRFSRGMQQRLGLAQALVHAPRVLILDEPASALDPEGVLQVRTLLQELRREGAAILLSSHQLSEVAMVSDRIAFLHEGELLRYGRLDELLESTGEMEIVLRDFTPDADFAAQWGAASAPGTWRIAAGEVRRFLETAWTRGAELVSATPVRGDLTTLFLEWTKKEQTSSEASRR